MKRIFLILVLLGSFCFAKAPGESGLIFLKMEDLYGLSKNPASLAKRERGANFMYSMPLNDVDDLKFISTDISYPLKTGVLGASVFYYGYGEMDEYDKRGTKTGNTWSAGDVCLSLSYARKVLGLSLGGTIKAIQSKIDDVSGQGFALDMGAIYDLPKISLGASLKDLGTKIKYDEEKTPLPLRLNLSVISDIPAIAKFSGELTIPNDNYPYITALIEKEIAKMLTLKFGYSSRKTAGSGIFGGFNILKFPVSLDYNYVPYEELGDSHIVSMGARF